MPSPPRRRCGWCARPAASCSTAAEVFDVYRGPQVGEGRHSLAIHLEFRAADRTLTDAEADAARDAIVAALGEQLGAELRA